MSDPDAPLTSPPEPVEVHGDVPPDVPSTRPMWAVVIAGPTIWIAHFGVVYLAAEAVCRAERLEGMRFLGPGALRWVIVVASVVAVLGCVATSVVGHRWATADGSDLDRAMVGRIGRLVAAGSALWVVAVGVSALVVGTC